MEGVSSVTDEEQAGFLRSFVLQHQQRVDGEEMPANRRRDMRMLHDIQCTYNRISATMFFSRF